MAIDTGIVFRRPPDSRNVCSTAFLMAHMVAGSMCLRAMRPSQLLIENIAHTKATTNEYTTRVYRSIHYALQDFRQQIKLIRSATMHTRF